LGRRQSQQLWKLATNLPAAPAARPQDPVVQEATPAAAATRPQPPSNVGGHRQLLQIAMVLPGHSFSLPEESLKEKALYQIKITFSINLSTYHACFATAILLLNTTDMLKLF
jgi:hypothetical protein